MIMWIFKLFGVEAKDGSIPGVEVVEPPVKLSKYKDFTVEHYPETGRFYPTYKGQYIKRNYNTGIYEFLADYLFTYAQYGTTEDEAWRIIDLVREQRLKENVKVITRD